jgi:hypothetical protein
MPSSIEYGETLRQTKAASSATRIVRDNAANLDPRDILAAQESMEQLAWRMDHVALTREQRAEFDQHIANIQRLFIDPEV